VPEPSKGGGGVTGADGSSAKAAPTPKDMRVIITSMESARDESFARKLFFIVLVISVANFISLMIFPRNIPMTWINDSNGLWVF